jgi:hypothetical protein
VRAATDTELPQLARGALVVVDDVVELEGVYLVRVVAREGVAEALDQLRQLGLVAGPDELSCGPPSGPSPDLALSLLASSGLRV